MVPVSHLAGRYELRRRIGGHGRTETWCAWDHVLARTVAVRLVGARRAAGPDFRHRFQQEVRSAAGVLHPHLVVIYDYGEALDANGRAAPYVITEFFDTESLAERSARGRQSIAETIQIFGQVAGALAAAHTVGLVHGDLKPSNVMLTEGGVKLLGLGIARVLRESTDPLGITEPLGTQIWRTADADDTEFGLSAMPVYLAPEDLGEAPPGPAADVYAFGVMLAEALTGSRALDAPLPPQLPAEIARLCRACRATDPQARPSASEAARLLRTRPIPSVPFRERPAAPSPTVERTADGAFSGPIPRVRMEDAQDKEESQDTEDAATAGAARVGAARVGAARVGAARVGAASVGAGRLNRARGRSAMLAMAVVLVVSGAVMMDRSPALVELLGGGTAPDQAARRASGDPSSGDPSSGDPSSGDPSSGDLSSGGTSADPQVLDRIPVDGLPSGVPVRTLAALARLRPLVEQGSVAGRIRSDVAVDLNNVITNLQNDLITGRQVDLRQRMTELSAKIVTRLREGALTRDQAEELIAALTAP